MMMRKKELISAAVLTAIFLSVHAAGAATVFYDPEEYAVFAGENLTIGSGSQIWGQAGAGGDALVYSGAMIIDNGYSGNLFANDDVTIGNNVRITGRVLGDNTSAGGGGFHGVRIADYVTIFGRIDAGGETIRGDVEVGHYSKTGSIYAAEDVVTLTNVEVRDNIDATNAAIGALSHIYGDLTYRMNYIIDPLAVVDGAVAKGNPIAPDDYTYALRTVPIFDETGTGGNQDITVDASLPPGVYQDLIVRSGVTLWLSAGTYDFRNVTLESIARISADTSAGDVVIKAYEDLLTTGGNILDHTGQGQLVIQTGDDLTIGENSTLEADLLAYSYDIYGYTSIVTIGNDTRIIGMVYSAGDLIIGERVITPEPGTMLLLAAGGISLLRRRRPLA